MSRKAGTPRQVTIYTHASSRLHVPGPSLATLRLHSRATREMKTHILHGLHDIQYALTHMIMCYKAESPSRASCVRVLSVVA